MRSLKSLCVIVYSLTLIGCEKEYSFEGRNTTIATDTTVRPPPVLYNFPVCSFCKTLTTTDLGTWSFKMENAIACGKVDTAIVTFGRTAFTFFGPSLCSADTGMVITVYLQDDTLNRDISYLITNKVAFYYYDRVTPSYMLMSQVYSPFSVSIEGYDHQSKIAVGTFNGFARFSDGRFVSINSGKFKVRLL